MSLLAVLVQMVLDCLRYPNGSEWQVDEDFKLIIQKELK